MTSLNVKAVGWGHEVAYYRTEVGVPSVTRKLHCELKELRAFR